MSMICRFSFLTVKEFLHQCQLGLVNRPVISGCAGCAMAHPDFGRSVNPISTRGGDRLCPPNYYWHTRIFRPSDDGPVESVFFFCRSHLCYRGSQGCSNLNFQTNWGEKKWVLRSPNIQKEDVPKWKIWKFYNPGWIRWCCYSEITL